MAKLTMIPRVIPSGLRFPPVDEAERTIGNSGQIHGAKMVTSPEIKEKKRSVSISEYSNM